MKLLSIFVTFCIGCCLAKFDEEQLETLNGFTKTCFKELNLPLDTNFSTQVIQNKVSSFSDQHIDYMVCMARKYGVLDEEGKYKTQLVKEIFFKSNTFDRAQVEEVVDLCYGEPKGKTVKENVVEANKCFFANKKFKLI